MIVNLELYCTLCKIGYFSKSEWNLHLISDLHQNRSSTDLSSWTKKTRKKAIILYSTFSLTKNKLAGAVSLINYFGGGAKNRSRYITDLVLSPNGRDKMAVLQFESKQKVLQTVGSAARDQSVVLELGRIQIQRVEDLLVLQWRDLLELFLGPDLCNTDWNVYHQQMPANSSVTSSPSVFQQFQQILSSIEIPPLEWTLVQNIITELKQQLSELLAPSRLDLFRFKNFLQLRNIPQSQTYYLYLHLLQTDNAGFKFIEIEKQVMEPFLNRLAGQTHLKLVPADHSENNSLEPEYQIIHIQSGLKFVISTSYYAILEYQLSHLLRYYCHFDTRVKPLLQVLHFWISSNKLVKCQASTSNRAQDWLSESVTYDWLLLFFLFENQDLIPKPQEILDRKHEPFRMRCGDDIGFQFDLDFAKNWQKGRNILQPENCSKEWIWSVLELFQKFCNYYHVGVSTPSALRMRKGEIAENVEGQQQPLVVRHPIVKRWKLWLDYDKWEKVVKPGMKITANKLALLMESCERDDNTGNGNSSFQMSTVKDALLFI